MGLQNILTMLCEISSQIHNNHTNIYTFSLLHYIFSLTTCTTLCLTTAHTQCQDSWACLLHTYTVLKTLWNLLVCLILCKYTTTVFFIMCKKAINKELKLHILVLLFVKKMFEIKHFVDFTIISEANHNLFTVVEPFNSIVHLNFGQE